MAASRRLGRSQLDASDAFHDYSCAPCSGEGKNTEASYQCIDCNVFYCQRCVTGHNKFTVNHSVVDRTSLRFGQLEKQQHKHEAVDLPNDVCEEHPGEIIKMFCGRHDLVCCAVCIAVKHRACNGVEYIPNVAKRLLTKHDTNKTEADLETVKTNLLRLKTKLQKDFQNLNKQRDAVIDDIRNFKKRIIARVEQLEKTSIRQVQTKHKDIARDINYHGVMVDNMLKKIESQLDKLRKTTGTNEAQLFVDIKYGKQQLSRGDNCFKQCSKKKFEAIEFGLNTEIENLLESTTDFGNLKTSVNILVPAETNQTAAFFEVLQDQLSRYNIYSECIEVSEIQDNRYTVVLVPEDQESGLTDWFKKNIRRKDKNKIIIVCLKNASASSSDLERMTGLWAYGIVCPFYYKVRRQRRSSEFLAVGLNKETFKALSIILRV